MKHQWQFTTDEENPEGYYQKLVNMNTPEVLSLKEAAERLNELEQQLKDGVDYHKEIASYWNSQAVKLAKECNELSEQLKKAESVIAFYASAINWKECERNEFEYGTAIISHEDYEYVKSEFAGGKLARQYLRSRGE